MVMFTPRLNADEASAANETLLTMIRENEGEIIRTDPWGKECLPIHRQAPGSTLLRKTT
jgi:ribosomal protein S6